MKFVLFPVNFYYYTIYGKTDISATLYILLNKAIFYHEKFNGF